MSEKKKKSPAQDAEGQGQTAGAGSEAKQADPSEPPQWFAKWQAEHQKQLDSRFDGLSRKQREQFKKLAADPEEPDEGDKKTAPQGLTEKDVDARMNAAMRLGEIKATLPEDARKRVDQYAKTHSITDVVEFAEAVLASQPETSKDDRKPAARAAARGVGASPPQDAEVPVRKEELRELAKKAATDPAARERMLEIAKSPGFNRKQLV